MFGIPSAITLALNLLAPSIVIGFLIGFGGVGGLLLAPALNVIGGMPIHEAVRLCMLVYVITGLIGTAVFVRNGYVDGRALFALMLGAGPGALLGAVSLNSISAFHLEFLLAIVIFAAGVYSLIRLRVNGNAQRTLTLPAQVLIGLVTGFGSALTGTGGPLILLPILLFAQIEGKPAVGLAQAIQIPIGVMATLGNMMTVGVDFSLGILLSVAVGIGVWAGALRSHRSSDGQIQSFLGIALIVIALAYGAYNFHALLPP